MTVIVYDHKKRTISVDSIITSGEVVSGRVNKFVHLPDGGMVFGCGNFANFKNIAASMVKAETPDPAWFDGVTVIHVDRTGNVFELDEGTYRESIKKSWAWGCGMQLALGALASGNTSKGAAEIAVKYHTLCGGPVHTFPTRT